MLRLAALARWTRTLVDVVFPRCCAGCAAGLPLGDPAALCSACAATFVPDPVPWRCPRCALPLTEGRRSCPDCTRHPPAFRSTFALAVYRAEPAGLNPVVRTVHALKYEGRREVARTLATLMATRHRFDPGAALVPVPAHPVRLRARGHDHTLRLAAALASRLALPLVGDALRRRRETPAQVGLDAETRRRNLTGVFAVGRPDRVRDRRLLLVDDVLTTGATADACARALLVAGAAQVDVCVVARTALGQRAEPRHDLSAARLGATGVRC